MYLKKLCLLVDFQWDAVCIVVLVFRFVRALPKRYVRNLHAPSLVWDRMAVCAVEWTAVIESLVRGLELERGWVPPVRHE